jgi:hypothetical protein
MNYKITVKFLLLTGLTQNFAKALILLIASKKLKSINSLKSLIHAKMAPFYSFKGQIPTLYLTSSYLKDS